MKGTGAAIKVGLTALIILTIGFFIFRFVSKGISGQKGYEVWSHFRDATGLVDKSRVQIAGLTIGEIKDRRLDGDRARVTVTVRPNVEIWSNAAIFKKSASLLGEFYLEIDPGTRYSPDPVHGGNKENFLLKDCEKEGHGEGCNEIKNVVEAVTANDIMMEVSETLPVLHDILQNVRRLTEGPLQNMITQFQEDVRRNSDQVEKLLEHVNKIVDDIGSFTHGQARDDLAKSMANVRQITEGVKGLIGSGEGQMNTTGDKIKRDLDKFADTLEKLNQSLDQVNKITTDVSDITGRLDRGEGTVGRLLKDDAIAENVTSITEDAAGFVRSLTRLQTIVGVRTEYNVMADSWKTYLSLKLMPRTDKYYLIELIDDPRGSKTYSHTFQEVGIGASKTDINTDTWNRSSAFRVSFMFAKRIMPWGKFGITGRIGIKESTGGLGLDFDFWNERLILNIDLFDFVAEQYPRLKILAALKLIEHVWIVGGIDDALNASTSDAAPANGSLVTCGPATPASWCHGGRDYFIGAMLTFNDEDLRALLTVGSGALASGASGK